MSLSAVKRRTASSHFIHLLLDGRRVRHAQSATDVVQSESRHSVTLRTQVDILLLAACPAHSHFFRACSSTQSLTPASRAFARAFHVAR
eukprot:3017334-Pyramimonas_sp.AAC.1